MFFLIDEEVSFPATFPVKFQAGVLMNEAVRQPIELLYPHKYRFSLPYFFQQTSTPLFPANGEAVEGGTEIELVSSGLSQTALVAPASST